MFEHFYSVIIKHFIFALLAIYSQSSAHDHNASANNSRPLASVQPKLNSSTTSKYDITFALLAIYHQSSVHDHNASVNNSHPQVSVQPELNFSNTSKYDISCDKMGEPLALSDLLSYMQKSDEKRTL